MRITTIIFLLITFNLFSQNGINTLKAFPTAVGPGSTASGGRSGILYIINTLDRNAPAVYTATNGSVQEYYTGGLYAALQLAQPAYIVFNVSGNITLGVGGTPSDFGWPGIPSVNNKTIFGQSAPQGGITITGGAFRFNGNSGDNNNLIFRYFRSRPRIARDGKAPAEALAFNYQPVYGSGGVGDDAWTWALLFSSGGNEIIADHMSFSFAHDKNIGATTNDESQYGIYNVTYQNNLLGDAGTNAYSEINPNQTGTYPLPEQRVNNHAYIKNVMAWSHRTPNMAYDGIGLISNNILFDIPFRHSTVYHDLNLNHEYNYYRNVNSGDGGEDAYNRLGNSEQNVSIYTKGNIFEGSTITLTGLEAENNEPIWSYFASSTKVPSQFFTNTRHVGMSTDYTALPITTVYEDLVTTGNVGAFQYLNDNGDPTIYRDSFDTSFLNYVVTDNDTYTGKQAANWVLPTIPSNTRPGSYDTDFDGMSDAWEIRVYGDLSQSYNGDFDGDGYTNIEEYMNQVDFTNTTIGVGAGVSIGSTQKKNASFGFINQ